MFFFRFRDKLGVKVVKALKRNDDGVTHAAIDMLCALMQVIIYFVPGDPLLTFKEVKKRKQFSSFITVQNINIFLFHSLHILPGNLFYTDPLHITMCLLDLVRGQRSKIKEEDVQKLCFITMHYSVTRLTVAT